MDQQKWDKTCMKLAYDVAEHSTCLRRKVGAVISKDNRIIATGFNGAPEGIPHCRKCLRDIENVPSGQRHELSRAVHAEMNAIIQCALHGVSPEDATIYVTVTPCSMCLKVLINARIKRIVVDRDIYPDKLTKDLLNDSGIVLEVLDTPKPKNTTDDNIRTLLCMEHELAKISPIPVADHGSISISKYNDIISSVDDMRELMKESKSKCPLTDYRPNFYFNTDTYVSPECSIHIINDKVLK